MNKNNLQPNTTQVPHIIIREWMPRLSDVELRVLLVVTDQTLGWLEDVATGRRKEMDWISHTQLCGKTGRGDRSITRAAKALIEKHHIIEAYDSEGELLNTAEKRRKTGGKIFYRLALRHPQATLFDTTAKMAGVGNKVGVTTPPPPKWRTPKVRTTKETLNTKLDTNNNKNLVRGLVVDTGPVSIKEILLARAA